MSSQTGNYYYDISLPISSTTLIAFMSDIDNNTSATQITYDTSYVHLIVSEAKIRIANSRVLGAARWLSIGVA